MSLKEIMKKTLILGCLSAFSLCFSQENEAHRVSFGADAYYMTHSASFKTEEIDNDCNLVARGVKWSYDYIKPDYLYLGLSGTLLLGHVNQKTIYFNFPYMEDDKELYADLNVKNRYAFEVKQAEFRSGGTLQILPELTITPFVGLSGRTSRVKSLRPQVYTLENLPKHPVVTTNCLEFLCGASSEYTYNENFSGGFGVKRYNIIHGRMHDGLGSVSFSESKGTWEFSLPLSYHFVCNETDRFLFSLEPYFFKQFHSHLGTGRGARLAMSCDF